MTYVGDFATGSTVRLPWSTNSATGAAITRSANGTVRIYKDAGTTERSSLNGVTDNEDFSSKTGIHLLVIDLSDDTDAGFYAAGHDYHVAVTGQTIDGQTVSVFVGSFSIQNRYSSGGGGLDAAGVRAALGMASANLDTQLSTLHDFLDTEIAAIQAKTDNLPSDPADASDIAALFTALPAALLDLIDGVETGLTVRQALRLTVAAAAGTLSGAATTTIAIRNAVANSKTRITATVDADGNRSAITTDLT